MWKKLDLKSTKPVVLKSSETKKKSSAHKKEGVQSKEPEISPGPYDEVLKFLYRKIEETTFSGNIHLFWTERAELVSKLTCGGNLQWLFNRSATGNDWYWRDIAHPVPWALLVDTNTKLRLKPDDETESDISGNDEPQRLEGYDDELEDLKKRGLSDRAEILEQFINGAHLQVWYRTGYDEVCKWRDMIHPIHPGMFSDRNVKIRIRPDWDFEEWKRNQ